MTTSSEDQKFVTPFGAASRSETFGDVHYGTVVSFSDERLVMAIPTSKQYSFRVTADTTVYCDGQVCPAESLKVGSRIRITPKPDEICIAKKIESLVHHLDFADVECITEASTR